MYMYAYVLCRNMYGTQGFRLTFSWKLSFIGIVSSMGLYIWVWKKKTFVTWHSFIRWFTLWDFFWRPLVLNILFPCYSSTFSINSFPLSLKGICVWLSLCMVFFFLLYALHCAYNGILHGRALGWVLWVLLCTYVYCRKIGNPRYKLAKY